MAPDISHHAYKLQKYRLMEGKFYLIEAEKNDSSGKSHGFCRKFCGICSWGLCGSLKKMEAKVPATSLEQWPNIFASPRVKRQLWASVPPGASSGAAMPMASRGRCCPAHGAQAAGTMAPRRQRARNILGHFLFQQIKILLTLHF